MKHIRMSRHTFQNEWCGKPQFNYSASARPSWKRWGEGVASFELHHDGDGMSLVAREVAMPDPDKSRTVAKEVMMHLDSADLEALWNFLGDQLGKNEVIEDYDDWFRNFIGVETYDEISNPTVSAFRRLKGSASK
jgi:hypothetical protein